MTNDAKPFRSVPPPFRPREEDETGRFRIEHKKARGGVMLPPVGDETEVSLEALGAVLERDSVNSMNGSFEDAKTIFRHSSRAPATSARASERAELVIEDLSLRPGNPYAASSLVPPAPKPFPIGKVLGLGAVVTLAVIGGLLIGRSTTPASAPQAVAAAASAPTPQQPVAVVPTQEQGLVAAAEQAPSVVKREAATSAVPAVEAVASPRPVATAPRSEIVSKPASAEPQIARVKPTAAPVLVPAVVAPAPTPTVVAETAVEETEAEPADTASEPVSLPETPSREAVASGFEGLRGALETCATGKHGIVKINATIVGAGRVSGSLIEGVFQGTPEGSCMARAVRTAKFPAFSQPNLKVAYAISL